MDLKIYSYGLLLFISFIFITTGIILSGKNQGHKIIDLIFVYMLVYISGRVFAHLSFGILNIKNWNKGLIKYFFRGDKLWWSYWFF